MGQNSETKKQREIQKRREVETLRAEIDALNAEIRALEVKIANKPRQEIELTKLKENIQILKTENGKDENIITENNNHLITQNDKALLDKFLDHQNAKFTSESEQNQRQLILLKTALHEKQKILAEKEKFLSFSSYIRSIFNFRSPVYFRSLTKYIPNINPYALTGALLLGGFVALNLFTFGIPATALGIGLSIGAVLISTGVGGIALKKAADADEKRMQAMNQQDPNAAKKASFFQRHKSKLQVLSFFGVIGTLPATLSLIVVAPVVSIFTSITATVSVMIGTKASLTDTGPQFSSPSNRPSTDDPAYLSRAKPSQIRNRKQILIELSQSVSPERSDISRNDVRTANDVTEDDATTTANDVRTAATEIETAVKEKDDREEYGKIDPELYHSEGEKPHSDSEEPHSDSDVDSDLENELFVPPFRPRGI